MLSCSIINLLNPSINSENSVENKFLFCFVLTVNAALIFLSNSIYFSISYKFCHRKDVGSGGGGATHPFRGMRVRKNSTDNNLATPKV